jgi:hypothetical protein
MADTDQAILVELQKLNRTVSQGGSMGAGSELKGGAADPDLRSTAKKQSEEEEKFQKKIQTAVSKSTNKYVAARAVELTSIKAIRKLADANSKKDLKKAAEIKKAYDAKLMSVDKATAAMEKAGFTQHDLGRTTDELKEEMDELTETVGNLDEKMDQQRETSAKTSRALATLGTIAAAVGKQIYDVAEASMRTGVEMTSQQIWQSRSMGMTQVELIEEQAKYRQVIESAGMTTGQWSDKMMESSHAMLTLTSSLAGGAKFFEESALTFRQLGASGMKQQEFYDAQVGVFTNLHNTLSMTNDEFMAMNKQLVESQATRVQLFKMSKQERAQYQIGLLQTMEYLKVQGLQTEQAHRVVEAMQNIAGMDPKSRLKKAAQIQAMAGAIGMGAEGEELARLTRSGASDPGSIQRMTELSQSIQSAVQQRQAGGLGSEMAMSALISRTGLGETFGAEGAMADLTLAEALAVDPNAQTTAANTTKIEEWQAKLFGITQGLMGFFSEGWIASILGALGISTLIGAFGSGGIMSSIWGAITSMASGLATGVTSIVSAITGMAGSLLSALGALGKTMLSGLGKLATGIGSRVATLAKGARVAAAPVAAAAAAAYGVQQAYQAITTGRSDVNDMLNSTETGRSIGEKIGSGIAHTLAFFGNDAAQEAIDINKRLEEQQARTNELAERQVATQEETNALQRRQIQTTERQTETLVNSNSDVAQQQNSNMRSINIRAAGRRRN